MKRIALCLLALPALSIAQENRVVPPAGWADDPPALASLVDFARTESTLRTAVVRYTQDAQALQRRYPVDYSPARIDRLRKHTEGWKQRVAALDFASLNFEGRSTTSRCVIASITTSSDSHSKSSAPRNSAAAAILRRHPASAGAAPGPQARRPARRGGHARQTGAPGAGAHGGTHRSRPRPGSLPDPDRQARWRFARRPSSRSCATR